MTDLTKLLTEARELIATGNFETGYCMCGSPVEGHSWADNHGPVDEGDYYASGLLERIDIALAEGK